VGEKLEYLYPEVLSGPIPRWPPDVFCLCASLLQRSGAYAVVVDDNPPHVKGTDSVKRAKQIERIGKEWRTACVSESALPRDLHRWWNVIIRNKNLPIQKLRTNQACAVALLICWARRMRPAIALESSVRI